MIDRTKFKYNIGDIVEIRINGNIYKGTIIAYCFSNYFNGYTDFYCYGIQIHNNKFGGHSCRHIPYDANGNILDINITNGWYAIEKNFKVVKSTKAFIYKLLYV